MKELVFEKTDTWIRAIETRYESIDPVKAYFKNRDMISNGYTHGVIDMVQVVELLRVNSIILESKGFNALEVLRNG